MAFEPGSELERRHKLRMGGLHQTKKVMGGLERQRAKRVAREVEVWRYRRHWAELASVVSAWAKGLADRRRGKRHNLVNEGSGDYGWYCPGWLLETGKRAWFQT